MSNLSAQLPWLALLPFAAALALAFVRNDQARLAAWVSGIAATLCCVGLGLAAPAVFSGEVLRWSIDWLPALGLRFGFRMDGLAWMFALLVLGIGALVVLYAAFYLERSEPIARFFLFLMLFMGAMLGIVLADNLILLVVFWELTSLSSFLLIGYWYGDAKKGREAREGARMALAITGAGGLCLLAGVLLIGQIVGSTDLDKVLASGDIIRAHPLYIVALVLVLLGAFTKSAQFPFHFWLPHAMAAPTPVSAYLHSATMVKAGVFLLARLYPALGSSEPWFWIVSLTGLTTLVIGAYMAVFKHDLKGLLAYSTISHLGLITLLFGLDEPLAVVAGVFHIMNHATFKAALFMAAGIIDHETGTRDMRKLRGLWRYMPWTGTLAMVACSAMAGVPLLNGFLSKEMFFTETVAKDTLVIMMWILPIGATIAGAFAVAYSIRFIHHVFFNGEPTELDRKPHEPHFLMRAPVDLLVLLCLAVGLLPATIVGPLLSVAAKAALFGGTTGELPQYKLALWHGVNLPLLMSALALIGGTLLYLLLQRDDRLHRIDKPPATPKNSGKDLFTAFVKSAQLRAPSLTGRLQTDSLQNYLLVLVVFAVAAGAIPFLGSQVQSAASVTSLPANPSFIAIWFIGIASSLATVIFYQQRLIALVLLGAVGLIVSLAFVYFSAPDLALTQLLVEIVTIILMMLALNWLPETSVSHPRESRWHLGRDALVAMAAGGGVACLAWMVIGRPFDSIANYYLANSAILGGGTNAVNVIIVDFRGFDTMGEIAVMGIAAIIIHALIADWIPAKTVTEISAKPESSARAHPLMLAVVGRAILPIAAMIAVYLYLRGHNLPGGGFVAGLVLAIALVLQFVANGNQHVAARINTGFSPWIAWGLLVAGASGIGSWFFKAPFLTSTYDYPVWPIFGAVPLASASFFDLGVFLTVVGGTMVALVSLARINEANQSMQDKKAPEAIK